MKMDEANLPRRTQRPISILSSGHWFVEEKKFSNESYTEEIITYQERETEDQEEKKLKWADSFPNEITQHLYFWPPSPPSSKARPRHRWRGASFAHQR